MNPQRFHSRQNSQQGFTLVESMVAAAVLVIGAGTLIGGFTIINQNSAYNRYDTAGDDILRSAVGLALTLPYSLDTNASDGLDEEVIPEFLKSPNDDPLTGAPLPSTFAYGSANRKTYTVAALSQYCGTEYTSGWSVIPAVPLYVQADPGRTTLTTAQITPVQTADFARRVTRTEDLSTQAQREFAVSEDDVATDLGIRIVEVETRYTHGGRAINDTRVVTFRVPN